MIEYHIINHTQFRVEIPGIAERRSYDYDIVEFVDSELVEAESIEREFG